MSEPLSENALVAFDGPMELVPFEPGHYGPEPAGQYRVLIVDGDPTHAEKVAETLAGQRYDCLVASSGTGGLQLIQRESFDIIIVDLVLDDVPGFKLLEAARRQQPLAQVIITAASQSVQAAVLAMHRGAFYYLEKPVEPATLRTVVDHAAMVVERNRHRAEPEVGKLSARPPLDRLIGSSDALSQVVERIRRVAPTDARVIILGETGTGKDVIARAIHELSNRRSKPYVALNCAELNPQILESELFGHVKGAYTGATSDREGRFEYADGGTLFLDEVGDMPRDVQVKLLRVIENGEIVRVGSNKPIKVNVRILSATNRDLDQMMNEGTFRSDLYYRLRTVKLLLPPLRERGQDVKLLTDYYLNKYSAQYGREIKQLAPGARRRLLNYDWPGNIRELMSVIEQIVVLAPPHGIITEEDLPPEIRGPALLTNQSTNCLSSLVGRSMDELERLFIEETLKHTGGNREQAAELLKIGQRTLYRKLAQYDAENRKSRDDD